MYKIHIKGFSFEYERERDLFNKLLKINGVTKKQFCEKFNLSYSYVNAWGSIISGKEKKFPSWVFVYLKDVMFFKISAIKVKLGQQIIESKIEQGQTLSDIYKEVYTIADEFDNIMFN